MESKREYHDAPSGEIKLPKEVYYICLWTVRDSERLKQMASVLDFEDESGQKSIEPGADAAYVEPDDLCTGDTRLVSDMTAQHAAYELQCIENAISSIPEVYREGLLDNIIRKAPLGDFAHPNTWKRWKLVFLYGLAKELHLI